MHIDQAKARLGLTPQSLDAALARHALIRGIGDTSTANASLPALTRRFAPAKLRKEVLERDAYRCRYCGKSVSNESANIDHVKPWPYGATELVNLVTACRDCNKAKGRSESVRWKDKARARKRR